MITLNSHLKENLKKKEFANLNVNGEIPQCKHFAFTNSILSDLALFFKVFVENLYIFLTMTPTPDRSCLLKKFLKY